jgi:glyoxylase-like metal-dependent hydrolase (beta-lactamase superfamily II)
MRHLPRLTVGGLLATLILPAAASAQQAASRAAAGPYEVYAVRYGTLPDFRVSSLVAGADPARRLDIPVMFWVVKAPGGRVFLVDCGFHQQRQIDQWKVRDFVNPASAVAGAGVRPADVTDIIITHMHWDHAGSLDLFPGATVWVQRDEFAYYTGDAWQPGGTHGGIEPDDVVAVARANTEGRLRLLGSDQTIVPGLDAHRGGCHTHASQYVTVKTDAGTIVLASDNVYMYENLEKRAPVAGADRACNLEAQQRMLSLASDPRLIVPGHDPAVFTKFTAVTPGVVRIR